MSRSDGPLTRIVSGCVALLIAAAAVYLAIHLLVAVWLPLVVIGGIGLFVAGLVWLIRARRRGW